MGIAQEAVRERSPKTTTGHPRIIKKEHVKPLKRGAQAPLFAVSEICVSKDIQPFF
jgi:hypothetical protein